MATRRDRPRPAPGNSHEIRVPTPLVCSVSVNSTDGSNSPVHFDPDAVHAKYLEERDKRLIPGRAAIRDLTGEHLFTKYLSLIHISEPTRQAEISYAVFCL